MSGNNVNHPNDFGHRLYAQVICRLYLSSCAMTLARVDTAGLHSVKFLGWRENSLKN